MNTDPVVPCPPEVPDTSAHPAAERASAPPGEQNFNRMIARACLARLRAAEKRLSGGSHWPFGPGNSVMVDHLPNLPGHFLEMDED
jgi:hypothetical protein